MGLGLALVKALVAEHGGSFDVTSRENVGTEITVMLPRGSSHAPRGRRKGSVFLGHGPIVRAIGVAPSQR